LAGSAVPACPLSRHPRPADALARQSIQRWTGQLVPPEYLGAHVSAPFSHQTGRYMPLALRCATALFGHLGIEWDITQASGEELDQLAAWIELYKRHRGLIHRSDPWPQPSFSSRPAEGPPADLS
jgi:alpha-galactosidase